MLKYFNYFYQTRSNSLVTPNNTSSYYKNSNSIIFFFLIGVTIMNWFLSLNPILQGFLATLFTWFITALGSSIVFFFKDVKKGILNAMLGFGAGVMIAGSFGLYLVLQYIL